MIYRQAIVDDTEDVFEIFQKNLKNKEQLEWYKQLFFSTDSSTLLMIDNDEVIGCAILTKAIHVSDEELLIWYLGPLMFRNGFATDGLRKKFLRFIQRTSEFQSVDSICSLGKIEDFPGWCLASDINLYSQFTCQMESLFIIYNHSEKVANQPGYILVPTKLFDLPK